MTSARKVDYVNVDALIPAERNPKKHRLDLLRASIGRFGFATPALRDERTGRLVVGHGRTEALIAMRDAGEDPPDGVKLDKDGRWMVPVVTGWASRSDAEAEAYLVADNRHTEIGGWDRDGLAGLLYELAGRDEELVRIAGWDDDELTALLNQAADLDDLAEELGDPEAADTWPTVHVRCAPHVAAGWREHLSAHGGTDNEALASLLQLDAEPELVTWAGAHAE